MEEQVPVNNTQNKPLVHDFNKDSLKNVFTPKVTTLLIVVIVVGIVSGY